MEFEDMKKIWSENEQQHLYAIDEEALHRRVLRQQAVAKRRATLFEGCLILVLLGLGAAMIIEGILDQEYYQLPEGAILLAMSAYVCWERWTRLKVAPRTEATLLGDIDRTLHTLDGHIRQQKRFVWYFVVPMVAAMGIHFVYTHEGKPWWLWVMALGSFVVSYAGVQRELRCCVMPRREALVTLRATLLAGADSELDGAES